MWAPHGAKAVEAPGIQVASSSQHLWLIHTDGQDKLTIYHRSMGDPPDSVEKLRTLKGTLAPRGLAAEDDRLWLVYQDSLSVQSISVRRAELNDGWESNRPSLEHGLLPQSAVSGGALLRSMAAGGSGPWALLRIESAQILSEIDVSGQNYAKHDTGAVVGRFPWVMPSNLPDGRPANAMNAETTTLSNERLARVEDLGEPPAPDGQVDKTMVPLDVATELPVDRLLRLQRGRWQRFELPTDWPHQSPAWLVAKDGSVPTLVVRPTADQATLRVYHWSGRQWDRQDFIVGGGGVIRPLAVEGQLVVAQVRQLPKLNPTYVESFVQLIRSGTASQVGTFTVEAANPLWSVSSVGSTVAMFVMPSELPDAGQAPPPLRGLHWARLDLQGQLVQEPTALTLRQRDPWNRSADVVIMASVLAASILIMLLFWRRDVKWSQLQLPKDIALADFSRRFISGLIDLVPGLAVAMGVYRIGLQQLIQQWPGQVNSFDAIEPGALAIAIVVVHTTIAELVSNRTIGKVLTGLRITTLNGSSPQPWQLLVRGLLKGFDLIAWPLLVLPLLGPFRQRLGDLVAGTVVIQPSVPSNQDQEHKADDD